MFIQLYTKTIFLTNTQFHIDPTQFCTKFSLEYRVGNTSPKNQWFYLRNFRLLMISPLLLYIQLFLCTYNHSISLLIMKL